MRIILLAVLLVLLFWAGILSAQDLPSDSFAISITRNEEEMLIVIETGDQMPIALPPMEIIAIRNASERDVESRMLQELFSDYTFSQTSHGACFALTINQHLNWTLPPECYDFGQPQVKPNINPAILFWARGGNVSGVYRLAIDFPTADNFNYNPNSGCAADDPSVCEFVFTRAEIATPTPLSSPTPTGTPTPTPTPLPPPSAYITTGQYASFIDLGGYMVGSDYYNQAWSSEDPSWLERQGTMVEYIEYAHRAYIESVSSNSPMDGITWYEAEAYCNSINRELPDDAYFAEIFASGDHRYFSADTSAERGRLEWVSTNQTIQIKAYMVDEDDVFVPGTDHNIPPDPEYVSPMVSIYFRCVEGR